MHPRRPPRRAVSSCEPRCGTGSAFRQPNRGIETRMSEQTSGTAESAESAESVVPVEEQVARANASGQVPVVFIHGLWLLASSWDRWAALFQEAGYAAVSPGWPDDPDTVAEAAADPKVFAG